jgi:hypothetical protein
MQPRDWQLLSEAIEFYNNRCGYEFVSLPWYVHGVSVEATAHYSWISNISGQYSKSLVGSAEQAFIDWDAQDALGKGRFVACTPCFRMHDEGRSPFHQGCFMKVELYSNMPDGSHFEHLMADAKEFFKHVGADVVEEVALDDGTFDLTLNGIEIGSYGARTFHHPVHDRTIHWSYGTGIAVPRFTLAEAHHA